MLVLSRWLEIFLFFSSCNYFEIRLFPPESMHYFIPQKTLIKQSFLSLEISMLYFNNHGKLRRIFPKSSHDKVNTSPCVMYSKRNKWIRNILLDQYNVAAIGSTHDFCSALMFWTACYHQWIYCYACFSLCIIKGCWVK